MKAWITPIFSILVTVSAHTQEFAEFSIENDLYKITVPKDFKQNPRFWIGLKNSEIKRELKPVIRLAFLEKDPQLGPFNMDGYGGTVQWLGSQKDIAKLNGEDFTANSFKIEKATFLFFFPKGKYGDVTLKVALPGAKEAPTFDMGLKTLESGWFSMGFTGIAATKPEKIDFLYQPLTWSWKRFPSAACMTEEAYSTTAATFINTAGYTEGIAPAIEMIPYRYALSTHWNNRKYSGRKGNSLFGLALRNSEGLAQPMLFAPLLGGEKSQMEKGEVYNFSCKYLLAKGDWLEGTEFFFKYIAKYKNERQNANVSLNQTLQNMIDFGMDDRFSGWVEEQKAFDYRFDAPGTVKMVSALHALGIAMLTADYAIYNRRALPLTEYAMSRQKFLFAVDTNQKMQSPTHLLKGPAAEIGELVGLYEMTKGKSSAFQKEAERIFGVPRQLNLETVTGGASWQDFMAKYKISGDSKDLEKAKEGANQYIANNVNKFPTDFNSNSGLKDKKAAFQIDFSSNIYDLFELYELTGNRAYLEASRIGARHLLLWTRSHPMAPDTLITVNKDGKIAGIFEGRREGTASHDFVPRDVLTKIPEQKIEAWKTSMVGLIPEQHSTYSWGPIMLTHHAAWFLRIAALTNDKLLADAAYNAVIGRYANFPGYYFNSLETNVFQKKTYPLHDYYDIKYNAIFYNHVWPHIALINDFLISDAYYRSAGKIDFPSVYAPGYAFLTTKMYGAKKGRIYDNENIRLWLPKDAFQRSDVALNHLFGISNDATYLVLMNTSETKIISELKLNQDVITYDTNKKYKVTIYDMAGNTKEERLLNGKLTLTVLPNSIATIKIHDLKMDIPMFQHFELPEPARSKQDFIRKTYPDSNLGTITAMLIQLNPVVSDAYIYTDITSDKVKKAVLKYKIGEGQWRTIEDTIYPYEFSVKIDKPNQPFVFQWSSIDLEGNVTRSDERQLVH